MALFAAEGKLNNVQGLRTIIFQSVPFTYNLNLDRRRKVSAENFVLLQI
jgi:hypothetical protein